MTFNMTFEFTNVGQPIATFPNHILDMEKVTREAAGDQQSNFSIVSARWIDGKMYVITQLDDDWRRTQPPLPEAPGDVEAMREACAKAIEIAVVEHTMHHPARAHLANMRWLWLIAADEILRALPLPKAKEEVGPVAYLYTSEWGDKDLLLSCHSELAQRLLEMGRTEQPLYAHPASRPEPVGEDWPAPLVCQKCGKAGLLSCGHVEDEEAAGEGGKK